MIQGELYILQNMVRLGRRVGLGKEEVIQELTLLISKGEIVEEKGIGFDGEIKCYKRK